jgi:hypothetical protein
MRFKTSSHAMPTGPIELVDPTLEFIALGIGDRNRLRSRGKAVPQLLEQPQPVFRTQLGDVDRTDAENYTPLDANASIRICAFQPSSLTVRYAICQA